MILFIQDTLDVFIALAVGDPHARVPYQQLRPEHVIGVPPGVKLCHPSNLSNDQLETIYNNIAHIKFIGKFSTYCYSVGFLKWALPSLVPRPCPQGGKGSGIHLALFGAHRYM